METLVPTRVLSTPQMTAPCLCVDVELSTDVPGIPGQEAPFGATCAWLLVSVHTEPIGSMVIEVPPEGLSGEQIKARWIDPNKAQKPPGSGDLFGIAMTPAGDGFYFVKDEDNTLAIAK